MAAGRGVGLVLLVIVPGLVVGSRFLALAFGISLKVNLVGIVGIVIAALTLRKF